MSRRDIHRTPIPERSPSRPPPKKCFFDHGDDYNEDDWRLPFLKFETRATASKYRHKRIAQLRCDPVSTHIADRVAECGGDARCLSLICPSCMRRLRRWWILEGDREITLNWSGEGKIATLTYIPPGTIFPEGQLANLDIGAFKDMVAHQLDRAGLGDVYCVGAVDISLNKRRGVPGKWWQPHVHLVVLCPDGRTAMRETLKALPAGDECVARPAQLKKATNLRQALGYCMRSYFDSRTLYTGARGHENAVKYPLKGAALQEMAVFLDPYPIQARLFLRNVRRRGSSLVTQPVEKVI